MGNHRSCTHVTEKLSKNHGTAHARSAWRLTTTTRTRTTKPLATGATPISQRSTNTMQNRTTLHAELTQKFTGSNDADSPPWRDHSEPPTAPRQLEPRLPWRALGNNNDSNDSNDNNDNNNDNANNRNNGNDNNDNNSNKNNNNDNSNNDS